MFKRANRRTTLRVLACAAFLPALGANQTFPARAARSAQLRAIEKLHAEDVAATLSGDPTALANLFIDDGVLLEPGSPAVVGKSAILAENRREKAADPDAKVLKYRPDIQDVQVSGGWAFEWGYFESSFRESRGTGRFNCESVW